ncbi:MAG: signal peptidase II [Deltaproteobacteria bacterium]|uniref:Lipoprotein signal peptidase n=1 Tax=Candidatus Desulfacyla euxinica TaxID=2841693 RepID=A0A8J6T4D5_9DELT|nr:signal peptidase II [Candidatus Desulfacyla euxinica]MBL7217423.1 signal peptidase II [Desulfobacteraceae bacterium]
MPKRLKRNYALIIWPALLIVVLDQLSKLLVTRGLRIHESVPVIEGFFNLVHVRNRGMAFGLMNRTHADFGFWLLVSTSIIAIGLLLFWFFRLKDGGTLITLGLSLILGGAVGNLIDRLRFREVIDFVDVFVGSYHWPAFNVADAAITTGTFLVAIALFFKRSPDPKHSEQ